MSQQVRACVPALTTPKGGRVYRPARCISRAPRPERRGVLRTRPRREGLGERLEHVSEVVARLPLAGGEWGYSAPVVNPDLKVFATPERSGAGLPALGSSKESNSQNQCRYGLSGISPHATRNIRNMLTLMEDFREKLAFITVTLPDEDYAAMAGTDIWPKFQRRYIDLLTRHLKAHGDPALVVGVVEIGDVRAKRTGRPMPHLHVCCTGYGTLLPGNRKLLSPKVNDELIELASRYAGLPTHLRGAAGQIQPVRKSVANYVSKYMTKQAKPADLDLSDGWEELIPRQWWNRSEGAKDLLEGKKFRLPPAFAAFMVLRQKQLEEAGLGRGNNVPIGYRKTITGDIPIEVFRFQFTTPEALHQALELYACWCLSEQQRMQSGDGGMWS